MRMTQLLLVTAMLYVSAAPAFAAYKPDFDGGVDIKLAVQAAVETAASAGGMIPEPPARPDPDKTIWISMDRNDVSALDDALFKTAPVAANSRIVIYEYEPSELYKLSEGMRRAFAREPGFMAHDTLESALRELEPAPVPPARSYTMDQAARVKELMAFVKEEPIVATITKLSSYKNRNYKSATGVDSSKWLQLEWGKFSEGREDISVEPFKHASYPQESVILTMKGTSEPGRVVVIGGHIDSAAGSWGGSSAEAPGADDNASGAAVTQEIVRALVEGGYRPAKTIKFIGFAAEEVGLRGSADIAAAFKASGEQVEGMLNLDMVNYKGSAKDIYFVSDYTSAPLNEFVGKLIDSYTGYTWGTFKCGYACSDHASWTKNGFPAATPFEASMHEMNPYIHSANDTIGQSGGGAEHALKFARLGVAYAVELAK